MTSKEQNLNSLSVKLSERRKVLDIDLEELSKKTDVQIKYLRRIEKGEWKRLPSSVYTKGFLRKYARAIGANPEEIVKRYQKEVLDKAKNQEISQSEGKKKSIQFPNISSRVLKISSTIIVLVLILGYIGYQLSAVFSSPELVISEPKEQEVVIQKDSIIFKGNVSKSADLLLNNELVSLNLGGFFEKKVELLPGLNVFEFKAISRFDKETIITKRIIFNQ